MSNLIFSIGADAGPGVADWIGTAIYPVHAVPSQLRPLMASVTIELSDGPTLKLDAVFVSCKTSNETLPFFDQPGGQSRPLVVGKRYELEFEQIWPAVRAEP